MSSTRTDVLLIGAVKDKPDGLIRHPFPTLRKPQVEGRGRAGVHVLHAREVPGVHVRLYETKHVGSVFRQTVVDLFGLNLQ